MDSVACQAQLSMRFFRQEYWSVFAFPSPGDLPDPGIESGSSALQSDSLLTELLGKPLKSDREKKQEKSVSSRTAFLLLSLSFLKNEIHERENIQADF